MRVSSKQLIFFSCDIYKRIAGQSQYKKREFVPMAQSGVSSHNGRAMTFKEFIEIIAALLTITLSLVALWGIFIAHRRGFFRAIRQTYEKFLDGKE